MNRMNKTILKGAFIAATVGGFFAAGASVAQADEKDGGQIVCEGANACKGKGGCAGGGHDCAGKNACKGQGTMKTTKKDCEAKGGKVAKAEEKPKTDGKMDKATK